MSTKAIAKAVTKPTSVVAITAELTAAFRDLTSTVGKRTEWEGKATTASTTLSFVIAAESLAQGVTVPAIIASLKAGKNIPDDSPMARQLRNVQTAASKLAAHAPALPTATDTVAAFEQALGGGDVTMSDLIALSPKEAETTLPLVFGGTDDPAAVAARARVSTAKARQNEANAAKAKERAKAAAEAKAKADRDAELSNVPAIATAVAGLSVTEVQRLVALIAKKGNQELWNAIRAAMQSADPATIGSANKRATPRKSSAVTVKVA